MAMDSECVRIEAVDGCREIIHFRHSFGSNHQIELFLLAMIIPMISRYALESEKKNAFQSHHR